MNNNDLLLTYLRTSCRGKRNRISGAKLSRMMGISLSVLQVRIRRLRHQNHPIASDAWGYYYAETAGEIFATIHRHQKIIRALEADIHGMIGALDALTVPKWEQDTGSGGGMHR